MAGVASDDRQIQLHNRILRSINGLSYTRQLWRIGRARPLRHGDRVTHDGAKVLTHVVVPRFARLHASYLVGGPRHQGVCALLVRIPAVRPAHPHEPVARLLDVSGMPDLPAIDAD